MVALDWLNGQQQPLRAGLAEGMFKPLSEGAAPGWGRSSSSGKLMSCSSARSWSDSFHARRSPRLDRLAVAFGEMVKDISLLVLHAARYRHVVAEHLPDGLLSALTL